jgi:hypothetical protein
MLCDWAEGELQPGASYAGWQREIRTCSLVDLPPGLVRKRQRSPEISAIIRRSFQGIAVARDLAALRSGRDAYSSLGAQELQEHLGFRERPITLTEKDDAEVKRVMRWMCRGLPEGLALQKVAVDAERTERARQISKRQHKNREPGQEDRRNAHP